MVDDMSNSYSCREKKRLFKQCGIIRSGDAALCPGVGGEVAYSPVRGHSFPASFILCQSLWMVLRSPLLSPAYVGLHRQTKEFVYRVNRYFLDEKDNLCAGSLATCSLLNYTDVIHAN